MRGGTVNRALRLALFGGAQSGAAPAAPSPLLDGLSAYWKFNGLTDATGNVADLSNAAGAQFASGKVGNAVSLVGTSSQSLEVADNDYVKYTGTSFEITGWVKFLSLPASGSWGVVSKGVADNLEYAVYIGNSAGNVRFRFGVQKADNSAFVAAIADAFGNISADTWYFFDCVFQKALNVVSIAINNGGWNSANTVGVRAATNAFAIGRYTTNYMTGLVDEIAIHKRLLTDNERTAMYNSGNGSTHPFSSITVTVDNPENATEPCTTPTADGSGEVNHPSVVDFGAGNTWNGYRYWLAVSGFDGGSDVYENTHILASADGLTWEAPPGMTNPIHTAEAGVYYHSDPELLYHGDTMYLVDRLTLKADLSTEIHLRTSTDGVTWSAPATLFSVAYVSPSLLWDGAQFVMYYSVGNALKRRTSNNMTDWSEEVDTDLDSVSHFDVIKRADGSYLLIKFIATSHIDLHTSANGLAWSAGEQIIAPSNNGWDATSLYRATMIEVTGGINIWYAATRGGVWHIGKTFMTI